MEKMKFEKGLYRAYVSEFRTALGWDGTYSVNFWYDGSPDYSCRGTYGTASKQYETLDKAIAAAKRYVNKVK